MNAQTRSKTSTNWAIEQLLKDEDTFLRRAGVRELTQAVLHFRTLASRATTPQLRDFYLDRANQFAFRTTTLLRAGG